jgi:predicted transposase/invertase (TIGR01784 family)
MDSINGIKTKEIADINKRGHDLLPLTNDYVFRRVFAEENTDALAEFIFCVTGTPASELDDIQVDDPHLHPEGEGLKRGELDVRVHTKSGGIVNVEIQLKSERAFRERIIYYSDRLFASRLGSGEGYGALNKTISIIITDFVLLKENNDHFNTFKWYNKDNGTLLSDMQEIHTLELPKLPDASDDTQLWRWLRLMKARKECEMEALAKEGSELGKVVATIRRLSADEREQRLAEAEDKWQWSLKANRDEGRDEGIEIGEKRGEKRGLKRGKELGLKSGKLEIARQMKADGMDSATISKYTGISKDEIDGLS